MKLSLLIALAASLAMLQPAWAQPADALMVGGLPLAKGPYDGTLDALNRYRCPPWYRDAKFGIWSHWGPQSVPMAGDWYARKMYEEGSDIYKFHLQTYGHPSKFGFKDIVPLWKGDGFDAERLMGLYEKAGAKYFVCAAVHFDNFDLWNSKFNRWNAVQMGARRDVVGEWRQAARRHGLRFGVSEHLAASFAWFQPSHGADKAGPLAGVPYDGADPRFQDFYHRRAVEGDGWITGDAEFQAEWQRRIRDLLDQHQPDLLLSDSPLPFSTIGSGLVSHFYNSSLLAQAGQVAEGAAPGQVLGEVAGQAQAVYICKQFGGSRWVQQAEGEAPGSIPDEPWQAAMTISDWYYRRGLTYCSASEIIGTLADTVSKNGNLLLNVTHRPDGSLDKEAEALLQEMADWFKVNGEAIYGTRPWSVFGERGLAPLGANGSVRTQDIRYTRRGDTLYAILLGWPGRQAVLRALAVDSPLAEGERPEVTMLGSPDVLLWKRTSAGLAVELPPQAPSRHATVLKISGLKMPTNLAPAAPSQWQQRLLAPGKAVWADESGSLALAPDQAELHGAMKVQDVGENRNIGYWDNPADFLTWDQIQVSQPGTYRVVLRAATAFPSADFVIEVAGRELKGQVLAGAGWYDFRPFEVGTVEIKEAGTITLKIRTVSPQTWHGIDIQSLLLLRTEPEAP